MIAMANESKLCRSCWTSKPIAEFRRRSRGAEARLSQCRSCHREAERCRRVQSRAKRDGRQVEQFAASAGRARNLSKVEAMLGSLYQRFGGVFGFTKALWAEYDAAPPGSYRRIKIMLMVGHLTEQNSVRQDAERKAQKREISLMTDEELEQKRMRLMRESIVSILAENPQRAVWAADQLGWTLILPDDSE
jgi:hypothetical protein